MSSLFITLHNQIPEGFHLSNLIFLDPEWQANIADDEGVIVATGESIEDALINASLKALSGTYVGKYKLNRTEGLLTNLAERLGLISKGRINRR